MLGLKILNLEHVINIKGHLFSPQFTSSAWFLDGKTTLQRAVCNRWYMPPMIKAEPFAPFSTHSSPFESCSCGIHAAMCFESLLGYMRRNSVLCLIKGSGKIIQHELGWRSEYAELVAVLAFFNQDSIAIGGDEWNKIFSACAVREKKEVFYPAPKPPIIYSQQREIAICLTESTACQQAVDLAEAYNFPYTTPLLALDRLYP